MTFGNPVHATAYLYRRSGYHRYALVPDYAVNQMLYLRVDVTLQKIRP